MRIALDAMGGDFAPGPNIVGAFEAIERIPDLEILLVGDRSALDKEISQVGSMPANVRIVESEGVVGMEEKPTEALRKKPNCSIAVCWQMMAAKEVDAVVSAGHTGAVVAAGLRTRLFLKNVKRPGIAVALPTMAGRSILMDIGANPAAKPEHLLQYGVMASILQDFPKARWHQYDPMARHGSVASTADAEPIYQFDKADVVVALDANFMCSGPGALRYTRDFSNRRRVSDDNKSMNRLYSVESSPTLTGAKADHRLTLKASDIEAFARALASAAGASAPGGGDAGRSWTADEQKWIDAVAKDLAAHRGRSLIVAGEYQPPAVHAIARSLNENSPLRSV